MSKPSIPEETLLAADIRAQHARERLQVTITQLQHRLDPRARAERVKREARIVGETALAIAQDNPARTRRIAAGTVLALGVLLGRHRIGHLFARKRPDISPATAGLTPVMRT